MEGGGRGSPGVWRVGLEVVLVCGGWWERWSSCVEGGARGGPGVWRVGVEVVLVCGGWG